MHKRFCVDGAERWRFVPAFLSLNLGGKSFRKGAFACSFCGIFTSRVRKVVPILWNRISDIDNSCPTHISPPGTLSAPRPKNGACLETLSTTIKGMDKDDLRLLESLVAARQRELTQEGISA